MSKFYLQLGRTCGLLLLLFAFTLPTQAQVLLTEHFEYTSTGDLAGDSLVRVSSPTPGTPATGLWRAHSQTIATPNNVMQVSGNLSLGSLPTLGNSISFTNSSQDINRVFTAQNSGAVYASFLVNLSAVATGDYFFHLGATPVSPASPLGVGAFTARLCAKVTTGGFLFGITRTGNGSSAVYTTNVYNLNTTYLVVVKHTFVAGATNDTVSMFVYATTGEIPATEPAGLLTDGGTGTDPTDISRVCIRQGSSTAAPIGKIDYIRVGTTWESVASAPIDNTPPTFTATFPKAQNVGTTAFDLLSNLNEAGKSYYVVLPDGATAPSGAQVKAGQDATSTTATIKGTINHANANTSYTANVTGLAQGTSYDVYVVGEDLSLNPTATVAKVDVTTTATDVLPPTFATDYPKANAVELTTFTLASKINEVGKTYFVILPDGATAPSPAQVKAGQDATSANVTLKGTIDNTIADIEATFPVTGLASATMYDVYVVAEDAVPNVQASVVKIDITTATPDNTAPTFTANYPKSSNVGSTSFRLLTNLNEKGKTYFVVLPSGANPPLPAQVKAGQDATSTALPANRKGTIDNVAGATEYSANISGLTQSTTYDVFAVAEDMPAFNTPNLQNSATKVIVTTTAPSTADIVEAFVACTTGTNIGTWTRFSVVGAAQEWRCATGTGRSDNGAGMNGFAGSAQDNEDWLISPALDLTAFASPTLTFWSKTRFQGPALGVKVSTNYSADAPSTATWADLTVTLPAANSNAWFETLDVDLTPYKSANTRVAFYYLSTTGTNTAAEWTIDDIKIFNKAPQIVLTKAQTLDVVTWNLEWFGDDRANTGPADGALQRANIKTVIQQIDADLYCLQEITNQNGQNNFQTLVNELAPLGYTGVRVTHSSGFGDAQQARAFIYKSSVFSNVTSQILPAGTWVDGRAPALFKADATVEGATKTFYFINIHAKAGAEATDFTQRQTNSTDLKTYIDANYGSNNVVFLGDFNDDLDMSIATPNNSPYKNFVDDVVNYATPSKLALSDKNITTFIGSTTPIDHIIVSNELNGSAYPKMYPNSLKREDYTSSIAQYAETTTDHYPVSIRFQLGDVTPDQTAPNFTATYPKILDITNFDFKVQSAITEEGKSYYVVLPDNAPEPTALQVKAGQNASGTQVANNFRGSIVHGTPNFASSATVTGIALLTDYDVYVVAEDIIPNVQASPVKVDVTAAPADIVPPSFTASYPKADLITANSFRLTTNLNERGKTYFVVLSNNATAPTSAQVKAGTNSSDVAIAANFKGTVTHTLENTNYYFNPIGATQDTDYDVYAVAEDNFNNLQLAPVKLDVKTNATVTSAEADIKRYLSIYPNPAQDKITIRLQQNPLLQKAEVRLISVWGKKVQEGKLAPAQEASTLTFDVQNLPAGVYILELSEGKRKFFHKVVVK